MQNPTLEVGSLVHRYFEGYEEWYQGEITEVVTDEDGETFFNVYYKADKTKSYKKEDEEELDYSEALKGVQDYQRRTSKTARSPPRQKANQQDTKLTPPRRKSKNAPVPDKRSPTKQSKLDGFFAKKTPERSGLGDRRVSNSSEDSSEIVSSGRRKFARKPPSPPIFLESTNSDDESTSSSLAIEVPQPAKRPRRSNIRTALLDTDSESSAEEISEESEEELDIESDESEDLVDVEEMSVESAKKPSRKRTPTKQPTEKKEGVKKRRVLGSPNTKSTPKSRKPTNHDSHDQIEAEISGSHSVSVQPRRKTKASETASLTESDATRNIVKKPYTAGDDLPIISDPQEMMIDMVSKVEWELLLPMIEAMSGRTLKVATMCSGTEAPILALDMLQTAIRDRLREKGMEGASEALKIEHVFSCEIEPFKQAYIERNFQPPLLFRDIRELGQDQAYTAYGALRDVPNTPGSVHLLIAGTSCVDYSNLNTKKKAINEKGESGQTFFGMIKWIEKAQPPIVLIENVSGAPWETKLQLFRERGYAAHFLRLDTKDYYIPQTRQRGYLFAVRQHKKDVFADRPSTWAKTLKSLKRPASAALDAFMLANDDPRVLRGRARLTAESTSSEGESRAGRVDWTKCETLHQQSRSLENLGGKRPLTNWSDSSNTAMPSFAWNEWTNAQVHRIHDLMDINTLRLAQNGIDGTYKTMVWNLSQNVGRDTMGKLGLSQCLTPTGVPYVANRGGVLVGEELLMLQGIPAEDLLLTKESEANLKDFAGNGMSTTVVGAVMLSALLHAHEAVSLVDDYSVGKVGAIVHSLVPRPLLPPTDVSIDTKSEAATVKDISLREELLNQKEWMTLLKDADSSSKKCLSEGETELIEPAALVACSACGVSARREYAVPPRKFEEHCFVPYETLCETSRAQVGQFRSTLLRHLPTQLRVQNIETSEFKKPSGLKTSTWEAWKASLTACTQESDDHNKFFFKELHRSQLWTAIYTSSSRARLECRVSNKGVVWFLFLEAPSEKGKLRDILLCPVARMKVTEPGPGEACCTLTEGTWEICLPEDVGIQVEVEGCGEILPSWRNKLGLTGEFASEYQYEKLNVTVDSKDARLKTAIDGTYVALPSCGGACGSLRRKEGVDGQPMYMFLESGRKTLPEEDAYVFSPSCHRARYLEYRETEIVMDKTFRAVHIHEKPQDFKAVVQATAPGLWIRCPKIFLDSSCTVGDSISVSCPSRSALTASQSSESWKTATQITGCTIPPVDPYTALAKMYKNSDSDTLDVNLAKSTRVFRDLAFVFARLKIPEILSPRTNDGWVALANDTDLVCKACAPSKPQVVWRSVSKGKSTMLLPVEDGQEAAVYERSMKNRPSPWLVRLEGNGKEVDYVKVAVNAVSLTQRALGCLPVMSFVRQRLLDASVPSAKGCIHEWRVVSHVEKTQGKFPKMVFKSNKDDPEAAQPPNFSRFPLRKEQLRSLTWMLAQERTQNPFLEEEVAESILPNLGWRAEGRVRRPVLVRGGIVADEVGYGKTAITLGLIDASDKVNGPPPEPPKGYKDAFIETGATLIVVPQHLMGQWPEEVRKFLGNKRKVVVLKNMASFNGTTINDITNADIVVASFQVLGNEMYYQHISRLCFGKSRMPSGNKGGRHFEAVYKECLESLKARVPHIVHNCRDAYASINSSAENQRESKTDETILLDGKKACYKNTGSKAKVKNEKKNNHTDPWGLSSAGVKAHYKKMKCPPLEMFYWKRVVVDEFTYLDSVKRERVLAFILGICSSYRWFLSGTPNHANFNDIQILATLLGVHLGVDETLPGVKMTKRASSNSDATGLDNLSLYLEMRSMQWHERRHGLAQKFLGQFVRQNQAEHDEIPWEQHEIYVDLPPVERAIYLELETYLKSLEMNSKNAQKSKRRSTGDRDSRMQQILQNSSSAEEALLKCCSHFNVNSSVSGLSAIETIKDIIAHRMHQKDELVASLVELVTDAFRMQHRILKDQDDWLSETSGEKGEMVSALKQYIHAVDSNQSVTHGADEEVHVVIANIVKEAENAFRENPCQVVPGFDDTATSDSGEGILAVLFPLKLRLRDHMHNVRSTGKELCGRIRSLRYIEWIHKFQTSTTTFNCSHCQRDGVNVSEAGVLSSCGHMGCLDCLKKLSAEEKCINAPSCQARVSSAHVVESSFFGQHVEDKSGGKYGKKLTTIVSTVKEIISKDRVIVFCQFDDLTAIIEKALLSSGVKSLQVKGTVAQQIKSLNVFQQEKPGKDDPRVLLLKMDDEQSAGLNLTMLNHAVFVHPLLADSLQEYIAYETQAIGRIRRFGQSKKVHIHRFLVNSTIDTQIYNQRTAEEKARNT